MKIDWKLKIKKKGAKILKSNYRQSVISRFGGKDRSLIARNRAKLAASCYAVIKPLCIACLGNSITSFFSGEIEVVPWKLGSRKRVIRVYEEKGSKVRVRIGLSDPK